MTISCNNLILFLSVVCVLSRAGEGRQCISSHNISNGTIQCSLYNLRSGSQSLSAGVSSDSATAPRPRLWLRLCVSVSESLSFSWVVSVGLRHTQSPHSGSGLLYLQPLSSVICQPRWQLPAPAPGVPVTTGTFQLSFRQYSMTTALRHCLSKGTKGAIILQSFLCHASN